MASDSQRGKAAAALAAAQAAQAAGDTADYDSDMLTYDYHTGKVGKGGILGDIGSVIDNPIFEGASDILASLIPGGAAFIPLINAGETGIGDALQGDNLGQSLEGAGEAGALSLAGQELGGLVGIGQGNTAFNSALGITGDNPAGIGLPNVGSGFSNTLSSIFGSGDSLATAETTDTSALGDQYGPVPEGTAATGGGSSIPTTGLPSTGPATSTLAPATLPSTGASGDASLLPSGVGASTPAPASLPSTAAASSAAAPPASVSSVLKALGQGDFSGALGQIGSSITPTQALGAAGLGVNALVGNRKTGAQQNQAALAGEESALGASQTALGESGQLTPGLQAQYQQQLQSNIAAIKSQYAQMGMSGSTSEQQAISQARLNYSSQIAQASQQEINTGLNALNMGSSANTTLAQQQMQQDQGLSSAIAALAGSGGAAAATKTKNE